MKSLGMISIIVVLCLTGSAYSQTQFGPIHQRSAVPAAAADRNGEEPEPPLVVRVYEVGDLSMADLPFYPAEKLNDMGDGRSLFSEKFEPFDQSSPQMLGGMGGSHAVKSAANSDKNDDLIDTITGVISPEVWEEVGGRSSIRGYGHLLVVSAPEKIQAEIRGLLGQLRGHIAARRTVVVEAHWLWLTEEQLRRLVPDSTGTVDEKAWEEHQKELAGEDSESIPGYHAVITCLNGQTVSTVAGRQRRFIISLIPVVGDDGTPASSRSVGYQPQSTTVQEGAALQVRPILCGDDQVLLDIHGRVVEVETPEPGEDPSACQASKKADGDGTDVHAIAAALDRPVVNVSRIDTTFRAPLGSRALIGGVTGSTSPEPDEPSLYLFAKVSVKQPLKESQKNK